MDSKASIQTYYFNKRRPEDGLFYVLSRSGEKTFVEDCKRKDPVRLSRIVKTLKRIYDYGCGYGFESKTIVIIQGTTC